MIPRDSLKNSSPVEVIGVAALLYNFYSVIERILKHGLNSHGVATPNSGSWHKDLIDSASKQGLISNKTADEFNEFLGFRHVFSKNYGFDLRTKRVKEIANEVVESWPQIKSKLMEIADKCPPAKSNDLDINL